MPIAIIIDWVGPYTGVDEFKKAMKEEWSHLNRCIYMALGKSNKLNYIGLTKSPSSRFKNHPKIHDESNVRFYVGEIVSQGIAGRRRRKTRPDLDIAEHALILALNPILNSQRKSSDLSDCISVFSRFFHAKPDENGDWLPARKLAKFPEFIGYNSYLGSWKVLR